MRHTTGTSIAEIRVLLDDALYMVLTAPDPTSIAWQWVSARREFNNTNPNTLKIELSLSGGGGGGEGGMAYFDNLCINFPQSSELMLRQHINFVHVRACLEEHA